LKVLEAGDPRGEVAPMRAEVVNALKATPIPGTSAVLVVDVFRFVVVLVNGETWWLDVRGTPQWRPGKSAA